MSSATSVTRNCSLILCLQLATELELLNCAMSSSFSKYLLGQFKCDKTSCITPSDKLGTSQARVLSLHISSLLPQSCLFTKIDEAKTNIKIIVYLHLDSPRIRLEGLISRASGKFRRGKNSSPEEGGQTEKRR